MFQNIKVLVLLALLNLTGCGLSLASGFPVSIEHKYGTALIEAKPERVVSISYIGHDFLLSLGVKPIALRRWYGTDPYGVWAWAQDALGDAKPFVMQGEIDVERIALLKPDLIEAQWSGMTEKEYRLLSSIAPTIGPQKGAGDYETSWVEMLRRLGLATGTTQLAESIVSGIDKRFAELRAAHPEWQGATATMSWAGTIGAYTSRDIRGQFIEQLGFIIPDAVNNLKGGNPYFSPIPDEDFSPLDVDALIWLDTGGSVSKLKKTPLRFTMQAYKEGREIYADPLLSSALSHSSPLSIEYAIDRLVPLLESAMDGDPDTPVASSMEVGLVPEN
ncbi:MAG: ABC transporter substrate-binding protein [Pseudomonadota bacterium]